MKHVLSIGLLVLLFAACGDKKASGGPDAPGDCTGTGLACADDTACCTGNCDDLSGLCARVPGVCGAANDSCQAGPDCCSFSCVNGGCSGSQCTSDGASCANDSECCGGVCSGNVCAPLNPSCKTSGNTCGGNAECCSSYCHNGLCSNSPSYCVQTGDTCTTDVECCGGMCQKSGTATLGTCIVAPSSGGGGCTNAGQVCGDGAAYSGGPLPTCGGECCSRSCLPYGPTGVLICQPPSGCRPTGELCTQDGDCCGSAGLPDGATTDVMCRKEPGNPVGRCDNGNSCAAAGMICRLDTTSCNATANCCAGNVHQFDTCHLDNLGIPRCGVAVDCSNPQAQVGMACASSADCCGLPCTPNGTGTFVCGGSCVVQGGTCTTAADCCAGLPCNVPPGSSSGTCGMPQGCSSYGQSCTIAADCCNGVPCTNGTCVSIIL